MQARTIGFLGKNLKGLLKFYLGQGLREDLAQLFYHRVMEATEKVLANHIQSEEEIAKIAVEPVEAWKKVCAKLAGVC